MTTQTEVHKKAQALLDAARKLPDVECPECGGVGLRQVLIQEWLDGRAELIVVKCWCIPTEGRVPGHRLLYHEKKGKK